MNATAPAGKMKKKVTQVYYQKPEVVKKSYEMQNSSTNFSSSKYSNATLDAMAAKLKAEFDALNNSRGEEHKEVFWKTEDGETDGFYDMMNDFYSSKKHDAPTSRLVK